MAPQVPQRTIRVPLLVLLTSVAAVEIVWTIFLGFHLPRHYVANHWDLAWVGIDVIEIALLIVTAWSAWRVKPNFIILASVTGTVFILDAWFDITTARRGDLVQSAWLAGVTEIPIAVALFWSAWRATRWFITSVSAPIDDTLVQRGEDRSGSA